MFKIGICDDEALHREQIKALCERFFIENALPYEFIEFSSGEEVLAYPDLKENKDKLHLLFQDIEMGEVNGLEVLREVEEADWIWRIIFVSSHEEVVFDTFSMKTLAFCRKPVEYHQIEKWLKIMIRENKENLLFEYMVGTQSGCVALEDVYYLEASGNYTRLYAKNINPVINENLKKWQKKTEGMPLVRIHKSYIINMQHVWKWEADKVSLENGEELAIGRQYAKEAKERYLAFVKQQALGRL